MLSTPLQQATRPSRTPWGFVAIALLSLAAFALMPRTASAESFVFYAHDTRTSTPGVWIGTDDTRHFRNVFTHTFADRGHLESLALSPGGDEVAYAFRGKTYVRDTVSGVERLVCCTNGARFTDASYTPDGAGLVGRYDGPAGRGLYKIDLAGVNLEPLRVQGTKPAVTSDGTLAFLRTTNLVGAPFPDNGGHLFVVEEDGAVPRLLTSPDVFRSIHSFHFIPDGQRLVVNATLANGDQGQYVLSLQGDILFPWTNGGLDCCAQWNGTGTHVLSTGARFEIWKPFDHEWSSIWAPNGLVSLGWSRYPQAPGGGDVPAAAEVSPEALLHTYSPVLRYDSQELYFADSAEMITDNYVGSDREGSNALLLEDGSTFATANPGLGFEPLNVDLLGDSYWQLIDPDNDVWLETPASDDDRIDERGSDDAQYQADAARLHGNAYYANKVYGRIRSDASGGTWLQYWLFYYYNPQRAGIFGGNHEGDWEVIQIGLGTDLSPSSVTYGRHRTEDAEMCPAARVERDGDTNRFVAYVANGSHANYFQPGGHGRFPLPADEADGFGLSRVPQLIDITNSPAWVHWPGRWGASDAVVRGPGHQGLKWDDPRGFALQANFCSIEPAEARALQRADVPTRRSLDRPHPPRPRISTVGRSSRTLHVSWSFARHELREPSRPRSLALTVRSSDSSQAPRGRSIRVRRRAGTTAVPLPSGAAPYRVMVAAYTKHGVRGAAAKTTTR